MSEHDSDIATLQAEVQHLTNTVQGLVEQVQLLTAQQNTWRGMLCGAAAVCTVGGTVLGALATLWLT